MKIIRNNFIPFPGYKAMNLFGVLFVRGNARIDDITLNHEKIHASQMKELLYVLFYAWYVIEWIVRLIQYLDTRDAYRNISFEREAYAHDHDQDYLDKRPALNMIEYL